MRIATATHQRLFGPDAGSKADLCRRRGHCWWHPDCFDVAELGATFLVGWVGADDGDSITASTGTPNTTDLGSVAGGTNALASALDHLLDLKKGVAVDYADVASCGYLTNTKMESVPAKAKDGQNQYLLSPDGTELGRSQIAGRRFEISNDLPATTKAQGPTSRLLLTGTLQTSLSLTDVGDLCRALSGFLKRHDGYQGDAVDGYCSVLRLIFRLKLGFVCI